jgi:hypothetical protein
VPVDFSGVLFEIACQGFEVRYGSRVIDPLRQSAASPRFIAQVGGLGHASPL